MSGAIAGRPAVHRWTAGLESSAAGGVGPPAANASRSNGFPQYGSRPRSQAHSDDAAYAGRNSGPHRSHWRTCTRSCSLWRSRSSFVIARITWPSAIAATPVGQTRRILPRAPPHTSTTPASTRARPPNSAAPATTSPISVVGRAHKRTRTDLTPAENRMTGSLAPGATAVAPSGTMSRVSAPPSSITRSFRSPVLDIWAHLTRPELLARWLGRGDLDLSRGAEFTIEHANGDTTRGHMIDAVPPVRLELSVRGSTTGRERGLTILLERDGPGSRITILEQDLREIERTRQRRFWTQALAALRSAMNDVGDASSWGADIPVLSRAILPRAAADLWPLIATGPGLDKW